MAKAARSRLFNMVPKLVFRDSDSTASAERSDTLKETNVELNWTNVDKSRTFKTVFLGDSNVGKTCLATLFVEHRVIERSTNTIGFDHHGKDVVVEEGVPVKLQIWDTAGMEQFRNALITKYYRNADGIVLVYDITKRESFESLEHWIREVKQYCAGGLERMQMVLIGNKLDLEEKRMVSIEEAQSLMRRYRMSQYLELSAKDITQLSKLEQLFVDLARQMLAVREKMEFTRSESLARSVIQLADDWEMISAPEDPIPQYVHRHQDDRLRNKASNCSC